MARLLSALGGLVSLLTVLAVGVLLAAPPETKTPSSPSQPSPTDAGETRSDARAPMPASWAALAGAAARLAAAEARWLGAALGRLAPQGLRLGDAAFVLRGTPLGAAVPIRFTGLRWRAVAGGWRLDGAGHVEGPAPVPFILDVRVREDAAAEHLDARLRVAQPGRLAALVPAAGVDVDGAAIAVDITADLAGGALAGPLDVVVRSLGPLTIAAAAMPDGLPVDALEAALAWDRAAGTIALRRLTLQSPAFSLDAHGRFGGDGLLLAVAMDRVDVAWAERVWPAGVADGARRWVTANIPRGRIDRLDMLLDLDAAALAGDGITADAVAGEARVSDAEIHYLQPMPPVTDARARAVFDGDELRFAIEGGRVETVVIDGGELTIRGYSDPATPERLEADLSATGEVSTILAVTDSEPLRLATRHGLPVASSGGSGSFRVRVGLPLLEQLALDQVALRFDGTFTGVDLPGMAAGRDLTDATVRLEAGTEVVTAEGEGRIAGLPLAFGYRLDAPADVQRLTASGRVDAARLRAFGLPAAIDVRGPVGIEAVLALEAERERTQLDLDLTAVEVEVPLLGVWKPQGIAGELRATVVEQASTAELAPLSISWPGLRIEAAGTFTADGRVQRLEIDPFRVAGTELRIDAERADGELGVDVTGARLDLAPILDGLSRLEPGRGGEPAPLPEMALSWSIDEVTAGGDAELTAARGTAETMPSGIRAARLTARSQASDAALRAEVAPDDGAGQRLTLASADAGTMLRALGLADTVVGGKLVVAARVTQQRPLLHARGELEATDFILANTPGIVRVLAAVPDDAGIAPEELRVDRFVTPFRLDGDTLRLDDAFLRASSLAMRASGTIELATGVVDIQGSLAPVAGLNRFIGGIPLLGQLLQGSKEAGAFALNFTVRGSRTDPVVSVNPLSVVTPGFLQDLFAGVAGEPPQIPDE